MKHFLIIWAAILGLLCLVSAFVISFVFCMYLITERHSLWGALLPAAIICTIVAARVSLDLED